MTTEMGWLALSIYGREALLLAAEFEGALETLQSTLDATREDSLAELQAHVDRAGQEGARLDVHRAVREIIDARL